MLLHSWSLNSTSNRLLQSANQSNRIDYDASCIFSRRKKVKVSSTIASLRPGTDMIVELTQNKALIAATACAAIGQFAKPLAAIILYKKEFNLRALFQAGGFPSSHSSAAVATAMSVGLERGFSDPVFGLAVVFAAITMYDAQGVRWEVGVHARTLNKVLTKNQLITYSSSDPNRSIESSSKKVSSSESMNSVKLENRVNSSCVIEELEKELETSGPISGQLKESIGHTQIEVAAGALLGLVTSLVVYSL